MTREFILLTSVSNEKESALILCVLNDEGIETKTEGEFTAGFMAEAPGEVRIYIKEKDLVKARSILDDSRKNSGLIVGDLYYRFSHLAYKTPERI